MRDELREVHHLKRLLTTTRLTESDRRAIEARIQELQASQEKAKREPLSPYLLGTFDRPKQQPLQPQPLPQVPEPRPSPAPEESNAPPASSQPEAGDEGKRPEELPLTPGEIDAKSKLLAEIVDRIMVLRAVWANTLSFEVLRETELWLKKLQEVAATIPHEVVENALGSHVGLLTQEVQAVNRPQISERLQKQLLAPSMPGDRFADVDAELYWLRFSPPERREPERPRLDPILGSGVCG
jgi:hypothetical protein